MRKLRFISGICFFLLSVSAVQSQESASRLEIFGSLGLGSYWGDESFRGNGLNFGGGVVFFPLSKLGIELQIDGGKHSRTFTSGVLFEGTTAHVSGSLIYRFSEGRLQFYTLLGGGILHKKETSKHPTDPPDIFISEGNSLALSSGGGVKVFLGSKTSVCPDFRIVLDGVDGVKWYWRGSIRAGYHW